MVNKEKWLCLQHIKRNRSFERSTTFVSSSVPAAAYSQSFHSLSTDFNSSFALSHPLLPFS